LVNRLSRRSVHDKRADSVAVIGLGRFGASVALELMSIGAEVFGIDADEEVVQRFNGQLTNVVQADTTDEVALQELSLAEFDKVVVSIGSKLEASILTCSLLLDMGVPDVWAKATSIPHGRILSQLGAHHVVYPETEMGRRIAHRVRGALLDFIEIGTNFALVRTEVPAALAGGTIDEEFFWRKYKVKPVAVKSPSLGWMPIVSDTIVNEGDLIQVVGKIDQVEAFARVQ